MRNQKQKRVTLMTYSDQPISQLSLIHHVHDQRKKSFDFFTTHWCHSKSENELKLEY